MKIFLIAVHRGAGEDSEFIQLHQSGYKAGLVFNIIEFRNSILHLTYRKALLET